MFIYAFTNATLIDHSFADQMLKVKNFVPALSIEGFREETDFKRRRTNLAVENAMRVLKEKNCPWYILLLYKQKLQVDRE